MREQNVVLGLLAHPDDVEFMCAGTLALLRQNGWEVHIGTLTPGDCGTAEMNREEISRVRRGEAARAAKMLDADYYCLECDDVFIMYDRQTLCRAIELIRKVRPRVVFAPSPADYMIDHEVSSNIVQTACFSAGMKNIEIPGVDLFEPVPYLYYVDALEGKDRFGQGIEPDIFVDISTVIDMKEQMLCCHESQRSWLVAHHGIDEYVISMKRFAGSRGKQAGCEYAEGFRQHLGHAYPQDNILGAVLENLVYNK